MSSGYNTSDCEDKSSHLGDCKDVLFDTSSEISECGPDYHNVGWLRSSALMMKTQIGLGVLSVPTAFDALGLVPGVFALVTIAAISTWGGYVIGCFRRNHPEVHGMDDAGFKMFGRAGRDFIGIVFYFYYVFAAGSAMIGISICLNTLSSHATCTAVFVAVACVLGFLLSSIRTLGRLGILAWIGVSCTSTAILTLAVAVALQDRPADAPQVGPWASDYKIANTPSFTQAITAISTIIFAYASIPAFFTIADEMREPRHYTRAVLVCQGTITTIYILVGVVVYYYAGSFVASPALGTAGPLMKKVCYGIAFPGLLVSEMLNLHISAKYVFFRFLRGAKDLASNSTMHLFTWLGCTFGTAMIAYITASGVPVFSGLVSLVGALLGPIMCFQPMGLMWIYDNWAKGRRNLTPKWFLLLTWNILIIVSGTFVMIAGTYGSVVNIIESHKRNGGSSWSCADNSDSR